MVPQIKVFLFSQHIIRLEDAFNLSDIRIITGYGNTDGISLTVDFQLTDTASYFGNHVVDNMEGNPILRHIISTSSHSSHHLSIAHFIDFTMLSFPLGQTFQIRLAEFLGLEEMIPSEILYRVQSVHIFQSPFVFPSRNNDILSYSYRNVNNQFQVLNT